MVSHKTISKTFLDRSYKGSLAEGDYQISTDTRTFEPGQVFIAIEGVNFNAMKFIDQILGKSPLIICHDTDENRALLKDENCCVLFVENSEKYMGELALEHIHDCRNNGKLKNVIGITGSNGKTTNKEMLVHLLKSTLGEKVHYTHGNLNNHIGVPLTVFALTADHEVLVLEMGTNHFGEIQYLCDISEPDCGLITSIGAAHLEFLEDLDGVLDEKSSLYRSIMNNTDEEGVFVRNADDPYLKRIEKTSNMLSFSEGDDEDIKIKIAPPCVQISGEVCAMISCENIIGNYNYINLVQTFLLANALYPDYHEEFVKACSSFKPGNMRSEWIHQGGKQIYFDAYNANPTSMENAILAFANNCKENSIDGNRQLYIVGDMNELGEDADKYHSKISMLLNSLKNIEVVFIGNFAKVYDTSYVSSSVQYKTVEDFLDDGGIEKFPTITHIFVKASRSLHLERLIR